MKILVKTAGMDRSQWLQWRNQGIGGSDVSVIAGVNKFKSIYSLWKEKTGQMEPAETENDYVHFGSILEPIVKQEFTRRTGLKVRAKRAILQSEKYPFMLANLDGLINVDGQMCIFEAKTASAYQQEVWERGVPFAYVLQVQHYMAVTGFQKAYVAAIVGGNYFIYHLVERNEVLIQSIIAMEKQFWEEHVLGGTEPKPDSSAATTAYLNGAYGESNGETVELPQEALYIFDRYDAVSEELEKLQEKKNLLSNQLKVYLKENEEGIVGNRKISWKQVQTKRLDQNKLKEEKPELYDKYLVEGSYRRFMVA